MLEAMDKFPGKRSEISLIPNAIEYFFIGKINSESSFPATITDFKSLPLSSHAVDQMGCLSLSRQVHKSSRDPKGPCSWGEPPGDPGRRRRTSPW